MNKIRTTIVVFDNTNGHLGIEPKEVTVPTIIDLDEVEAYRPDLNDKGDGFTGTVVYLKSGNNFCIGLDYDTFDALMPGEYVKFKDNAKR